MAINRNLEKIREGPGAAYAAHPTAPKGYAWDVHDPKGQENTTPSSAPQASKPAVKETVSAEVSSANGKDDSPKTTENRVNTPH